MRAPRSIVVTEFDADRARLQRHYRAGCEIARLLEDIGGIGVQEIATEQRRFPQLGTHPQSQAQEVVGRYDVIDGVRRAELCALPACVGVFGASETLQAR